jgi:hypothetical protein
MRTETGWSPTTPRTGLLFGIDFWHAVEFSRSGRTPISTPRGRSRGNLANLAGPSRRCQTSPTTNRPSPARSTPPTGVLLGVEVSGSPPDRPPVRCPLLPAGDVENIRTADGRRQIRAASRRVHHYHHYHRPLCRSAFSPCPATTSPGQPADGSAPLAGSSPPLAGWQRARRPVTAGDHDHERLPVVGTGDRT